MALDFPNNPNFGDTFTSGTKTWKWNGFQWVAKNATPIINTAGGDVRGGLNVGGGFGVYKDKIGENLRFKTLKSGTNIEVNEAFDVFTLNAPTAIVGSQDVPGASGEASLVPAVPKKDFNLQFKKIKAGVGITITNGEQDVTITNNAIPASTNSYSYLNTIFCDGFSHNATVAPLPCWTLPANGRTSNASSFYIMRDGSLRACGYNNDGSTGTGKTERITLPQICAFMPPLQMGEKVIRVTYNYNSTYVITSSYRLYTTGNNSQGQLGLGVIGAPDFVSRKVFTRVETIANVIDVSCGTGNNGKNAVLVLTQEGDVYSFGDGTSGSLGTKLNTDKNSIPFLIPALPPIQQILMIGGGDVPTGYLLDIDGNIWSAGNNAYFELGRPIVATPAALANAQKWTYTKIIVPDDADGPVIFDKMWGVGDVQFKTIWARTTNKRVYAWGYNNNTSYGVGSGFGGTSVVATPNQIGSLEGVKEIYGVYGTSWGSFAATFDNGDFKVWGNNTYGNQGRGPNGVNAPVTISPATSYESIWPFDTTKIKDVAIGTGGGNGAVMAILMQDGTIWTAGYGTRGALGTGTSANSNTFKQVPFNYLMGIPLHIECFNTGYANGIHFKVLLNNGKVVMWGYQDGTWSVGTDATPNTEFTPAYVLFS